MLSSKRIRPLSKIQPLANGQTRLRAYALLYKGMLDGIMSLAGFQVTATFRQNRNSGDYEFILTSVSFVCSQETRSKRNAFTPQCAATSTECPLRCLPLVSSAAAARPSREAR